MNTITSINKAVRFMAQCVNKAKHTTSSEELRKLLEQAIKTYEIVIKAVKDGNIEEGDYRVRYVVDAANTVNTLWMTNCKMRSMR